LVEVHQSNQILPIYNSFIQFWATSNSLVQSRAMWKSSLKMLVCSEMSGLIIIRFLFNFG